MKMKKLFAGLVATSMIAAMGTSAMAATYDDKNGTVAIGADLTEYAGEQVTVLIVEAVEGATPANIDDTMILYIDQDEAKDGVFQSMGVKGGALEAGKTYIVRIGGTTLSDKGIIEEVITIPAESTGIEITLNYGDVNGDTSVGSADASLILQKAVGSITGFVDPEGRAIPETVADVNGDTSVGSADASLILQKAVGSITGFVDPEGKPLTTYTYTYTAPDAE